jgi:hypothetical protein
MGVLSSPEIPSSEKCTVPTHGSSFFAIPRGGYFIWRFARSKGTPRMCCDLRELYDNSHTFPTEGSLRLFGDREFLDRGEHRLLRQDLGIRGIEEGREDQSEIFDVENQLLQRTHELEQSRSFSLDTWMLVRGESVMPIPNTKALDVAQERMHSDSLESV